VAGKEEEAIKALRNIPEIKRLVEVLGPYDLVMEAEISDPTRLNDLVIRKIRSLESVQETLTLIVARERK